MNIKLSQFSKSLQASIREELSIGGPASTPRYSRPKDKELDAILKQFSILQSKVGYGKYTTDELQSILEDIRANVEKLEKAIRDQLNNS